MSAASQGCMEGFENEQYNQFCSLYSLLWSFLFFLCKGYIVHNENSGDLYTYIRNLYNIRMSMYVRSNQSNILTFLVWTNASPVEVLPVLLLALFPMWQRVSFSLSTVVLSDKTYPSSVQCRTRAVVHFSFTFRLDSFLVLPSSTALDTSQLLVASKTNQ